MPRLILASSVITLLSLAGCVSQKVSMQAHPPTMESPLTSEGEEHLKAEESPAGAQSFSFPAVASMLPPEPEAGSSLKLDFQVAPWYQFHRAALSLTFDDGTLDQYFVAYPELERRNLKATFFLLTDHVDDGAWMDFQRSRRLMNWDQVRELAEKGHEIGSHGHTHRELLEGEHIEEELRLSQAIIEREIPSQRCISLSWPFWRSSSAARRLAEKYYAAARAGGADPQRYLARNGDVLSSNQENLFEVGSMGILADEAILWSDVGDTAFLAESWIVLCLHGVDDGRLERDALGWHAMPLGSFRALLDYIQVRDLWIAPFGDVARYLRERQNIELEILEETEKRLVFLFTDGLDDGIFDQPLSLRIRLPDGWEAVRVLQGSRLIPFAVQADGWLLFDATPDKGLIRIIQKNPNNP